MVKTLQGALKVIGYLKKNNSRLKTIAYYIGVLGCGGIEASVINIIRYIDSKKIRIDIILDSPKYMTNKLYCEEFEQMGVHILYLSDFQKGEGKFFKLKAFFFLLRFKKYDGIHLHISYPSSMLYALPIRMAGCKCIFATSHANGAADMKRVFLLVQKISRMLFPFLLSSRFAVSEEAGKWCYGDRMYSVIPNGIDVRRFRFNENSRECVRKSLGIGKKEVLLGHIGRFVKEKNHRFLFDLFVAYNQINPNSKLLLVGEGKLKKIIEQKCLDLKIEDKIIFKPFSSFPEKYYWAMDIFLFPSLSEGFGIVALEAQAASLPIIASKNVPKSTRVSRLIKYLPLDLEVWKKEISKIKIIDRSSVDVSGIVMYDIRNVSLKFENEYLK